jgi:hypothetical protein
MGPGNTMSTTQTILAWPFSVFTERGGKVSFLRVAAAFILWAILHLALRDKPIPDKLAEMFYALISLAFASKLVPAITDAAKAKLTTATGAQPSEPPK